MHIQKFEIALDLGGWETTIFIKGIGLVLRELSSVAVFREPTIEDHFKKASTQNLSDKANESVAEVGTKGELATIVQANEAEEKKATQRAIKRAKGDRQEGDVVAIGNDVRKIFGKTGETVSIKYPIVAGQVVDVELGGKMLNHFLSKLATIRVDDAVIKATVIIPLYISIDEREKLKEVCYLAGISEVEFMPSAVCVPAGFGKDRGKGTSYLVVDMGASKTDIAIVDGDSIVSGVTLLLGGKDCDANIVDYVQKVYNLKISRFSARKLKHSIGSLMSKDTASQEVSGVDVNTNSPRIEVVEAVDIKNAMYNVYNSIAGEVVNLINKTSEETLKDVMQTGILLSGGASAVLGFKNLLTNRAKLPVEEYSYPKNVCIMGAGAYLNTEEKKD